MNKPDIIIEINKGNVIAVKCETDLKVKIINHDRLKNTADDEEVNDYLELQEIADKMPKIY